jgi:reactive intermediate/imine deaminase
MRSPGAVRFAAGSIGPSLQQKDHTMIYAFLRPALPLVLLTTLACAVDASAQTAGSAGAEGAAAPVFTSSELPYPFSSAVQVGDVLYLSGDLGAAGDGSTVVPGGIEPETRRMFERIEATLQAHGLGLDSLFKCTVMLADMEDWPAFNAIYAQYFEPGRYPTRSAMGVSGLALGASVEMECWAWNPR